MSGEVMPSFRPWFEKYLGVDINYCTPSQLRSDLSLPVPVVHKAFLDYLKQLNISFSNAAQHRLMRSHGHTVHEMWKLRHGKFERLVDLVVWPKNEADIVKIVDGANKFNVVLIPIGGGTSVSHALECPQHEKRCVCSIDLALMNKILSVDEANLLCKAEAGIIGLKLEHELNAKGFTCGHEPDSIELSTLGGWIATRASGMKKNKYGNIEDLLVHVNMVTSKGIVRKHCLVPRISGGPDLHEVILGSEGILGVISEATIKIFPLPEVKKFGSFIFPTFANGVNFIREVALQRCQPASLRLVDNEQFIMGQSLKIQGKSLWEKLASSFNFLVMILENLVIFVFLVGEMVAATIGYEGTAQEVEAQERKLNAIAETFKGVAGGEDGGKYGYMLTFAIAYLRDMGMEFSVLGESFETSVPWSKALQLCYNVKELIKREARANGVKYPVLSTCRVTQVYDNGACVYFYFGFNYRGVKDPLSVYDKIEAAARDEILACGGSISHHHGVGKLRRPWMRATVGETGISIIKAIKDELDPRVIKFCHFLLIFLLTAILLIWKEASFKGAWHYYRSSLFLATFIPLVQRLLPQLLSTLHKGQCGRIGVVGGSATYTGAPFFAAMTALRVGADMIHVFSPPDAAAVIKCYSPELMVHPSVDSETLYDVSRRLDAFVLGPGLGRADNSLAVVEHTVGAARERNIPIVIDAVSPITAFIFTEKIALSFFYLDDFIVSSFFDFKDGLFFIGRKLDIIKGYKSAILTPNFPEFGRLYDAAFNGQKPSDEKLKNGCAAKELAAELGCTIFQKGEKDIITNGAKVLIGEEQGCPRRCGGQGDLLSGTLGVFAYWATMRNEPDPTLVASEAASQFIRTAAKRCFQKVGRSMVASDIINEVHQLIQEVDRVMMSQEN
uniref:ATP-dependent (S)-NAD(P)H-hydrate dehydratase n=1 Tax=Syphacia muris TaxID=451379 RepID=A0A0N5AGU1_9BILA